GAVGGRLAGTGGAGAPRGGVAGVGGRGARSRLRALRSSGEDSPWRAIGRRQPWSLWRHAGGVAGRAHRGAGLRSGRALDLLARRRCWLGAAGRAGDAAGGALRLGLGGGSLRRARLGPRFARFTFTA